MRLFTKPYCDKQAYLFTVGLPVNFLPVFELEVMVMIGKQNDRKTGWS